jgi:predicted nucleic acid-binding protein
VVATRPIANNGLGMDTPLAKSTLDDLMKVMSILPDNADVFPEWQRLVVDLDCKGKVAHDARIVAAMNVHGVSEILTFNSRDFSRYTNITVLNPEVESSRQSGLT